MGINQTVNSSILLVSTIVIADHERTAVSGSASIAPLLIPVIVVWLGPIIRRRSLQVQEALGVMTESAEEQFGGIRVTKKFAVEDTMKRRFGTTVDRIRDKLRLVRVSSLFQSIIPFLGATSHYRPLIRRLPDHSGTDYGRKLCRIDALHSYADESARRSAMSLMSFSARGLRLTD